VHAPADAEVMFEVANDFFCHSTLPLALCHILAGPRLFRRLTSLGIMPAGVLVGISFGVAAIALLSGRSGRSESFRHNYAPAGGVIAYAAMTGEISCALPKETGRRLTGRNASESAKR
jgi:hypothetical protein